MQLRCELCPKLCLIGPGQTGECRIRANIDGKLVALTYGYPSAVHVDPIEKKPLNHMLPGSRIFSIATVGCNLHCKNCQNWQISQTNPERATAHHLPPEQIPAIARANHCRSVAYTYTDPIVYYEYALQASRLSREAGLYNVLVSAGYINEPPLRELCAVTDAANIDLKSIRDRFYRDVCGATLRPVQNALVVAKSLGVMVEITNLVIPSLNDSDDDLRDLSRWICRNMGAETPVHFSAFRPHYRMQHLPPTPSRTLTRAREIAQAEGLHHVYVGNVLLADSANTRCPACNETVVVRRGFTILKNRLRTGRCDNCNHEVYGRWQ